MTDTIFLLLTTIHNFVFLILNKINFYNVYFYKSNVLLLISSIVFCLIVVDILKNDVLKEYYIERKHFFQKRNKSSMNFKELRSNIYMLFFAILIFFNAISIFCAMYEPNQSKNILDMFLNYDSIRNKEVLGKYGQGMKFVYEMMSLLCILFIIRMLIPFKHTGDSFINITFNKMISEKKVLSFLVVIFIVFNFDIYSYINNMSIEKGMHNTKSLESLLFLTVLFFITDKQSIILSKFKTNNFYFYASTIFILQIIINIQFIGYSITNMFLFNILLLFMFFYLRDSLPLLKPSPIFSICFTISFIIQVTVSLKILNEENFVTLINTYISFFIFFYKYYIDKVIKDLFKRSSLNE